MRLFDAKPKKKNKKIIYAEMDDGGIVKIKLIKSVSEIWCHDCLGTWSPYCFSSTSLRAIADYLDKRNGVPIRKRK